jgi:hypothetical protein
VIRVLLNDFRDSSLWTPFWSAIGPRGARGFTATMAGWGVPFEVLADKGKQLTGKVTRPIPVEALFQRTCRDVHVPPPAPRKDPTN